MQKPIRYYSIWLLLLALLSSCHLNSTRAVTDNDMKNDAFIIHRGVNISHWLSQSQRRGEERAAFFTEKDIEYIASLGYDHIRLPLDEMHLWNENGQKDTAAFCLLHKAIAWCEKHKLRIVADLHVVRSHYFNASYNPLWDEEEERDKFVGFWKQLSAELRRYPNDLLAYELLNEPVAHQSEDWNSLIRKSLATIRECEPRRTVVIGSNKWQSVDTFSKLDIPENDQYIILSFHFYSPHVFTHYQAPWSKKVGYYKGPVHYPGHPLKENYLLDYDSAQVAQLMEDDGFYNKIFFLERLKQPLSIAEKYGLRLYCGEFGCFPTTPLEDRVAWYSDLTEVFEQYGIAWANWDYKGSFGIIERETMVPRTEIINALLNNE